MKVAFITKFPVDFFTAMEDAAKVRRAEQPATIDSTLLLQDAVRRRTARSAQIEDAVAKGFQAIVITPMGPDVSGAERRGRQRPRSRARRQRPRRLHQEGRGGRDRQRQGRAAGRRLPQVRPQVGRHDRPDGGRARRTCARRPHPGCARTRSTPGVKVIIGGAETKCDAAKGATVAEDLLTRGPTSTAIYSACDDPAIAAAKVAKQKGKPDHGRSATTALPTRRRRSRPATMTPRSRSSPARWPPWASQPP